MEKGDGSVVIVVNADSRDAEKKLKDVAKKAQALQDTLKGGKNIVFSMDVSEAEREMRRVQSGIEALQEKIREKNIYLAGVKSEYSQREVDYNNAKLAKNYELAARISGELDTLDKKAQKYENDIADANTKINVQKQYLAEVTRAIVAQQKVAEETTAKRTAEIFAINEEIAKQKEKTKWESEDYAAEEKTAETSKKRAQYSKETAAAYKNLKQLSEQIGAQEEKANAAKSRAFAAEKAKQMAAAAEETARFQRETDQAAQKFVNELNQTNVPLSKMEKSYDSLRRKILASTQKIAEMRNQQAAAQQAAAQQTAELDREKSILAQMQATSGKRKSPELSDQQERVRALQAEYNRLAGQVDSYDRKIMDSERLLRQQVTDAEDLAARIQAANSPAGKLSRAFAKASTQVGKLAKRISGLAQRVFIFSMITAALRAVREYVSGFVKNNSEAAASLAQLKGAFLTLAQPIMETVLPVLVKFLNVLTRIVQVMANLVSRLLGKNVSTMAQNAKNLNKQLNGTSKAADKAANSLAAFDEINQLNNQNNSSSGGDSGSDSIAPDFSGFEPEMQSELDKLTAIVAGAALAVGAILALSGINIPLGIGLMAIGAAVLYEEAKLNWDNLPEQIQDKISGFLVLAGIVALAIGLILALSGANIPLGIGLIALGAAALASAAGLNWDELGGTVSEKLATIGAVVGALIAVIGVVLLLAGNIPLGIACIIAGIAIFSVSAANLNWDSVGGKVKTVLSTMMAAIGAFVAVIGVILTLIGKLPLGIACIIAGISIFAAGSVAMQWDSVPNTVKDKLALILKVIGGALVVLGVILLMTGVGVPWGIGCILAGIAALGVSQIIPNWDFILKKISESWTNIKGYFSKNIAPYLSVSYWKEQASGLIDGLCAGIANGAGKVINALKGMLTSAWDKVSSTASGIWDTITGSGRSSRNRAAASPQLTTARVELANIPALAKGAVIPANREFLAVLGDQSSGRNLEAPESLIRQIVREESGGANTQLLQAILDAIREGQVIMVDKQQLGRTVQSSLSSMQRAGLVKV